ncbi:MAG: hypothetical protein ACLR2G_00175 [Phascolarctobacterium faecium]
MIMGGALAGLGGAYLSLAYAPCWLENMTRTRLDRGGTCNFALWIHGVRCLVRIFRRH